MELTDAMRTMHTNRFYKPDDVPDDVFYDAMEVARFGPQGGNRQPVRFIIVKDAEKKKQLGEWYIEPWSAYYQASLEGMQAIQAESGVDKATWIGYKNPITALNNANEFAKSYGEHPAIVVVCAAIADTHPTDTDLDRLSIVGGASVYPTAQNFCLALRNQGVATSFTTLLVAYEPQVKELLDIPDEYATACHIVAGYPAKDFPKKLSRRPVEELAFVDTFGNSLTRAGSAVA
jgi:nitroreductase